MPRPRVPRWVAPALWAAFVLTMSTDLGSGSNTGALLSPVLSWFGFGETAAAFLHGAFRAAGHAFAYGLFAFLVWRAARATLARPAALALALALALATLDETLQGLVARERTADVLDVLLDLGAAAGVLAVLTSYARRREATVRP